MLLLLWKHLHFSWDIHKKSTKVFPHFLFCSKEEKEWTRSQNKETNQQQKNDKDTVFPQSFLLQKDSPATPFKQLHLSLNTLDHSFLIFKHINISQQWRRKKICKNSLSPPPPSIWPIPPPWTCLNCSLETISRHHRYPEFEFRIGKPSCASCSSAESSKGAAGTSVGSDMAGRPFTASSKVPRWPYLPILRRQQSAS